ncbi:sigma-70 region 4 domain-containing protein [Simplicispira psychrophila]|uniref:sigma-70 region 4 domain-containing protein n=1 Tax=Simplicispira psychrophila TaxID=80882 RepID=UPI0006893233|nr:sigma-70 region 4 domain-containing protein [Simplicispira psychrophila]
MIDALQPPVAKTRLSPEQRAQVLELRRTHSAGEVSRITDLPLGTVKALVSRAGATRDNTAARAFFTLPPLALPDTTAVTIPAPLPEQRSVTGDKDVDAMLWLREVVATGDGDLIAKALQAAERIKTPAKELERRYGVLVKFFRTQR